MKYPQLTNFIAGKAIKTDGHYLDIYAPQTGEIISRVPLSGAVELDQAVQAARQAFPAWAALPIKERVQIFYRYRSLLEKHKAELSALVVEENGKTMEEAVAEVDKSIEVTEFACSLPQLVAGEVEEVSQDVECRSDRKPVGVIASITPFNFPNMVPHWTLPNALALGNTMILKPSEQTPLSANRIGELLQEAGLPDGVFNIVHGAQVVVEAICDNPRIDGISFVGSTRVAKIVYRRGTSTYKRVLALGGAKNYLIVLPDAHEDMTASDIAVSMSGCCGQRCMAAATMIAVGELDSIINKLCAEARNIIPGDNLGAVISQAAKDRIEGYITEAEQQGAKILVDGRGATVAGKENGFYVGPTVIDFVTPDMRIAKEEVFGPVLTIIRVDSVDEALKIENASEYGNAAGVFTQSGGLAKYVTERASAGMIGVNIGVPVPREPFSFGGWNESKFGVGDITGKSSIEFWTRLKKTTIKWNPEARTNWMS
ncbi:MAG: CoA-acylating methylmalonate-semialdehyde dehydrogenase [Candidatus Marinimicrobia bacterium]|nr:CoA-acylating methylmalonate-semialdehyde dehydrogenase [Candidatus Neomarinimicrobiota bacterium]